MPRSAAVCCCGKGEARRTIVLLVVLVLVLVLVHVVELDGRVLQCVWVSPPARRVRQQQLQRRTLIVGDGSTCVLNAVGRLQRAAGAPAGSPVWWRSVVLLVVLLLLLLLLVVVVVVWVLAARWLRKSSLQTMRDSHAATQAVCLQTKLHWRAARVERGGQYLHGGADGAASVAGEGTGTGGGAAAGAGDATKLLTAAVSVATQRSPGTTGTSNTATVGRVLRRLQHLQLLLQLLLR